MTWWRIAQSISRTWQRVRQICNPAPDSRTSELAATQQANADALLARRQATAEKERATAEKERASAAESRAKTRSTYLDMTQKAVRNAALAYGLAASFEYFFLSIHFFPAGLTLGDSLLFLFIAIGYGFVSCILAILGMVIWLPEMVARMASEDAGLQATQSTNFTTTFGRCGLGLSVAAVALPLLLKALWPNLPLQGLYIAWLVVAAVVFGVQFRTLLSFDRFLLVTIFGVVVIGILPWMMFSAGAQLAVLLINAGLSGSALWVALRMLDKDPENAQADKSPKNQDTDEASTTSGRRPADEGHEQKLRTRRLIGAVFFASFGLILPLFFDHAELDGNIGAYVLTQLGLRANNATVRLTGAALETARTQAAINDSPVSFCFDSDGSALVSPVTVLWHGPGTRSFLALGPTRELAMPARRAAVPQFEIAASEARVIAPGARQCRDVQHEVLFTSNSVQPVLADQSRRLLDEMEHAARDLYPSAVPAAAAASAAHWGLERVIIGGYSDDMELPADGNEHLARRRAACVAAMVLGRLAQIGDAPGLKPYVDWEGQGARALTKSCPASAMPARREECNADNRHSHVRLIFECHDAQGQPAQACPIGPPETASSATPTHPSPSLLAVPETAAALDVARVCAEKP